MAAFGRSAGPAPGPSRRARRGGRQVQLGPMYPPGFVGATYGYGFPGLENPWGDGYGYNSGNPPGTLPPGYPANLPFRSGYAPPFRGGPMTGAPGPFSGFVPGFQRSDALLRDDTRRRLDRDPALRDADIQVLVQNAEVTLTGTVQNRAQKRHARDLADAVPGVVDVHNRLTIANLNPA